MTFHALFVNSLSIWMEFIKGRLQRLWASLIAQLVKNPPACMRPWFDSWVGKIPWRRDKLPTPVFLGFPDDSDGKESTCNVGDMGLVPGLGRSPGGGCGNPLQYSCRENPHGQRNLAGYSPTGHKESDNTEQLSSNIQPINSVVTVLGK